MSTFDLVEMAKSYFNNDLVSKASETLGENENSIAKAIQAAIPSIIIGTADKAHSTEGATQIANMAAEQSNSGILDNLNNFLEPENNHNLLSKSSSMISAIYGNSGQSNTITNLISNFAGIKSSSVGNILSMVAPAILGFIGKYMQTNELQASGLSSFLNTQKQEALNALPAGFSLPTYKNTNTQHSSSHINTAHVEHGHEENKKTGLGMGWLLPFLVLAGLSIAALYYFSKGCNNSGNINHTTATHDNANQITDQPTIMNENTTMVAAGVIDTLTGEFNYNEGAITTFTLPNGAELKVGANSTEAKLINFLNDKNAIIDTVKGNWFEFTNVHFKTGGADLTEQSANQLKNMVSISKAYATAQFKFGGYTDNTGDANKNIALSQKRADAVAAMVIKLGAATTSFAAAKGYGAEHPIGDNATAEGKAMNRRVAVNVKAK